MNRNSTKGFTLIEVLVVIAIISVLITILLPSFNAARKKPYDVAALQCGKAVVNAETTYLGEHNNVFASSFAALNNSDVTEQCSSANGVYTSGVQPGTNAATGGGIGGGNSNYYFFVWNQNGTGIYYYNKDSITDRFRKTN